MTWGDLTVVSVLIVAWVATSSKLSRFGLTEAMVFAGFGLALGGERGLHMTLSTSSLRVVAELTLVLILFSDASRVRLPSLGRDAGLPGRLLGIGLPLTVLLGALAAFVVIGGIGWWLAILIGAILAPTDASLGAAIVSDTRVPSRVRRALNVESGLNDGIVAPLVSLAIAVLAGGSLHESAHALAALGEIGIGVAVGVGIGIGSGVLLRWAVQHGWTTIEGAAVAGTAAAVACFALADVLGANGFIAAFVGGLAFGSVREEAEDGAIVIAERAGQLLSCFVWFAFGAAMLRPALSSPALGRAVLYAVLSLTVIRMVPVAASLLGTRLDAATSSYVGWFGPRGMASVVFALLASDELGSGAALVLPVVSVTVALSVLVHGLSANPLTDRYASILSRLDRGHPVLRDVAVPPARTDLGQLLSPREP